MSLQVQDCTLQVKLLQNPRERAHVVPTPWFLKITARKRDQGSWDKRWILSHQETRTLTDEELWQRQRHSGPYLWVKSGTAQASKGVSYGL